MTDLDKNQAKQVYESLEDALKKWKQTDNAPEFCACGEQILPVEPKEKTIYCDKQNQWIHKADQLGLRPYWYGLCPAFAKKETNKSIQEQRETGYKTLDGKPMDLSTFERGANEKGYGKALSFVKFGGSGRLIFGAETGRGKTHLARAIFMELIAQRKTVRWITARDLSELFVKAQPAREGKESQVAAVRRIEGFKKAHCFFLDDLGSEKETASDLFCEQLQGLLEQLSGGFVITTNLDSEIIKDRYGAKIFARLFVNADFVVLKNSDYRAKRYPKLKVLNGTT